MNESSIFDYLSNFEGTISRKLFWVSLFGEGIL